MMELPPDKRFFFRDGTSAKNLNELKEKIEEMSYDEFYSHVTESKNDFANWIRFVLRDEKLADDLQNVLSIVETVEILNDYLHPRVAQKHLDSLDDIQSHIEKEEFSIDSFNLPPIKGFKEDDSIEAEEDKVQNTFQSPEKEPEVSVHYKKSNVEDSEIKEFHHDVDRMIVKDFIMGMFLGIIIGLLLGKALALF